MTLLQTILEKFEQLPESLQAEASHYIEFLHDKHIKKSGQENVVPKKVQTKESEIGGES